MHSLIETSRRARARVAGALAVALLVSACGGDGEGSQADDSPTTSPTSTTPSVPEGITAPGRTFKVGKTATVVFKGNPKHTSRIRVTVTKVRQGKIRDLSQFTLDAKAERSAVYYVDAVVRNVGPGDLSGQSLTLYGKVSDDLVVPPVVFGSPYPTCNYHPFPKGFTKDKRTSMCLVIFAPRDGKVSQVQWRGAETEPIAWVLR